MFRIFDTTVWIDYFNGINDPKTDFLYQCIANDGVCMIGIIVQDVLQGIKHDGQYQEVKSHFGKMPLLPAPTFESYESAAQLYRSLRKKGVTIRKANDCLIASYAIHFDLELCHNDSDFDLIAANSSLKIWKPI
jgi:predicted nucleic acid-binding protein